MAWSYNKLWIELINRGMKRTDLLHKAGLSSHSLAKMGKNEPVSLESIGKICALFHCDVGDLVSYIPDPEPDDPSAS